MGIYFATDIDRINNEYMPRLNLEIGRYINYSKLESMLSTQTLFFCNASRFDDEYEGEIPLEFFDGWAQQSEENYRRLNELKSHVYVPYVTCWTPYKTGNTKMWNEYASDNGVCIVSTVRQIFMLSRINGARICLCLSANKRMIRHNQRYSSCFISRWTKSRKKRRVEVLQRALIKTRSFHCWHHMLN